jgi:hypothetical protein
MAAILAFLRLEARLSRVIGSRLGRSPYVDRALTTIGSIVARRRLSGYRKSDSFLSGMFYTLAVIRPCSPCRIRDLAYALVRFRSPVFAT